MTIEQINQLLVNSGFQVFIHHTTQDNVEDTYIVVLENDSGNYLYDNKVYMPASYYSLILHTYDNKRTHELTIENILNDNNIVWSKSNDYIAEFFIYTTRYEIKLWV